MMNYQHKPRNVSLWTKISKTWCLSALFLLATIVAADAGDYTYTTNSDNTLTITKYTGSGGEVVIPSAIDGKNVTVIGGNAFGGSLFYPNLSLTSVTIPNSVTRIGDAAFYICYNLTSVTIGNSVTNIGDDVFWMCTKLTSITIPDSVKSIGNRTFSDCHSLTSVTIPDSVISIGTGAFYNCDSMNIITIGNGLISIGYLAFQYCDSLISIIVDSENSVYSSVDGVLFNKSQTMLIQYPVGKVGSYTIPNGVISIGTAAFWHCDNLTSVTIPSGVTSIEESAFQYCGSLTNITISDSVTSIGNEAFAYSHLTSVMIPDSVICIGNYAFDCCTRLISVTIGSGVTSIGKYAFDDCTNLMGVYFTGNAPSIGSGVFDYDNLATVYYLPGTTGWGLTFSGRPAMQWWDGPQISANGIREDVAINSGDTLRIAVAMDADSHVGFLVDWWVLVRAGSSWYYLNNAGQWTQYDGSTLNCHPAYQGGLFNLSTVEVLNARGLQPGSYTFWFAIDYPMDGVLNLGGYILMDSVNVTVQ